MKKRERLFEIVEIAEQGDTASKLYDWLMIIAALFSMVPLAFKQTNPVLEWINHITVTLFIIDYFLRMITADYRLEEGTASFIIYPVSPLALIDLMSILPIISSLGTQFRVLRLIRIGNTLRVFKMFRFFRAFRLFRYSKSIDIVLDVIRDQKAPLLAVCTLALSYTFVAALIIFNVEPDTFETFYDAFYWALVSLTSLGYGDIYPVTTSGRIVTMLSSVMGIAIIALPSGIITAGYLEEIYNRNEDETDENDIDADRRSTDREEGI